MSFIFKFRDASYISINMKESPITPFSQLLRIKSNSLDQPFSSFQFPQKTTVTHLTAFQETADSIVLEIQEHHYFEPKIVVMVELFCYEHTKLRKLLSEAADLDEEDLITEVAAVSDKDLLRIFDGNPSNLIQAISLTDMIDARPISFALGSLLTYRLLHVVDSSPVKLTKQQELPIHLEYSLMEEIATDVFRETSSSVVLLKNK